ncbi:hypothetical protein BDY21DRAFT_198082 [Lineolata rhizophorae]|uniref:Uncharacterized protein n=1 Tax=Lineolata rhizophorae TaxID=578093 RepID=A0A6A6P589_9PEZI|nr:hypothetical protein BDY21DRAFT_198082 [Lineolata rhizophorae]
MSSSGYENYPFNISSYFSAFDDGQLCQKELKEESTSWRSEKYPPDSHVLILDHDKCTSKSNYYDDEGIDKLLESPKQPQIRFILMEPNVHEKAAEAVRRNEKAAKVLRANELQEETSKAAATRSTKSADSSVLVDEKLRPEVPDELNVSHDSLLKILKRYNFAPGACSHIRGQEQIFGSRVNRDGKGEIQSFEFWYAIRARMYLRDARKDADMKMTIVTNYDVRNKTTVVLIKYRSFNDLPDHLKVELTDKLKELVAQPTTAALAENPFALSLFHFNSTIQYYRRAARDPRDSVRNEVRKAHQGRKQLESIDLQQLHLTLTSLDQDKVQLNFILGVIKRLRKQHDAFYKQVRKMPDLDRRDWLFYRVEEELDRFENQITYFKTSIEDVASTAQRLMDLMFNMNSRFDSQANAEMAKNAMREGAATRTIAIVSMLFLPGTFVSGILGTNIISGPENEPSSSASAPKDTRLLVSSQWWILVVASVGLTALTFFCWFIWKRSTDKAIDRREKDLEDKV